MGISKALVLCLLVVSPLGSFGAEQGVSANPIRKVVTMLQVMQKKITAEGEEELKLYDKFMCYCKTSDGDLAKSIAAAETKVPEVTSDIGETEGKISQLEADLKKAQVDRSDAKAVVKEATALRAKAAESFSKEETDLKTNIAALTSAIGALEKGMAGAFLQSGSVEPLRRLIVDREDLTDFDREQLASFLSTSADYAPKSGQITGILKQLQDSMAAELEKATSEEETAIAENEALMKAKAKEIAANTKAIETKTELLGEAKVTLVTLKDDLKDTQVALEEDKKFLANLDENCAKKTAEHEANMKSRAEELVALADTIKILNDDDALEIFKKTLPSAASSLLQVKVADRQQRRAALQEILAEERKQGKPRPELNFIALAMMGKKYSFEKVLKMIDDMVVLLKNEQLDDDNKVEYCKVQIDQAEDKAKDLANKVKDAEIKLEELSSDLETNKEDIKVIEKEIAELDKSVEDATAQRKEENEDFTELMSTNNAAKELLAFAKNRLQKFYSPGLYKAPEDESFVQISSVAHADSKRQAPPPPPATWDAYQKKDAESKSVVSMLDLLIRDLDKEMTAASTQEELSQKSYEELMQDSAAKRAKDMKSMQLKQKAKADIETSITQYSGELTVTKKESVAVAQFEMNLHSECDWLLQNFDLRKSARAEETENLKQAKAVLSGADFSLLEARSERKPSLLSRRRSN
mmetsp:Transcript_14683/g.26014  ORF Transcript_14683/g.26014 Transcript_14683/m.26014 type:complete len:698 (-) Transcript_14683:86-2179(-)